MKDEFDQFYISYAQEYKYDISYFKRNERQYYLQEIKPFLIRLYNIFDKLISKDQNKIYQKIILLLKNIKNEDLGQDHLVKQKNLGIDMVNLKWRNFVDSD